MAAPESELIQKSKNGDIAAFEELICAYQKKTLNLAYRMLGNRPDAEDATQDIFLRVYRSIGGFNEESSFSTWIYKIATNVCLDALRKRKRQNLNNTVSISQQSADDEEYELPIEDSGPSPYEAAQKKEAMRALERALEKLNEEQKTVIVMRDINGFSYEEIATSLDCTLGTIKSRINRARLALRKLLEEDRELFL